MIVPIFGLSGSKSLIKYAPLAASQWGAIPNEVLSGIVIGGLVKCRAIIGTSRARAAPKTTGTSLYSQGCKFIILPLGKSWVTPGAKIPKWVRESSAVSGPE
ncbi:MAG: hypothetical protein DDT22_01311 [candidate division WS2 bacterium]|nr:hypothetical protein [Candidatus Lithacetigena glycinireducens]MBT9175627.1 hypothetical protein [Candidatus Lithacetigena glycinireducens]